MSRNPKRQRERPHELGPEERSSIAYLRVDAATGALELKEPPEFDSRFGARPIVPPTGKSPIQVLRGYYGDQSLIHLTNCRTVQGGEIVWRDVWIQ